MEDLPLLGDGDSGTWYEYQTARIRNYMRKRMIEDGWTPKFYTWNKVIMEDHVARFYGAMLAKCLMEIN